jgi:predicted nucleic acid-binding protein
VIERYFHLLPDSLATYHVWRQLVTQYAVVGAQAHDARLIASMHVYGISQLLAFNVEHFRRYCDITVIEPRHVAQTS